MDRPITIEEPTPSVEAIEFVGTNARDVRRFARRTWPDARIEFDPDSNPPASMRLVLERGKDLSLNIGDWLVRPGHGVNPAALSAHAPVGGFVITSRAVLTEWAGGTLPTPNPTTSKENE